MVKLAAPSQSAGPDRDSLEPQTAVNTPRVSVVLATYNRWPTLERLIHQLGEQTFPSDQFEVIVVDDGSAEPVAPRLARIPTRFSLRVIRQQNAGAAAARHRGVMEARSDILVILDDDMQLPKQFLEEHLRWHRPGVPAVVMGRYRSDPNIEQMPLFERWYAKKWEEWSAQFAGGMKPHGTALCTGNVSMRREDYLKVGGFDLSLDRSEDAELGLKLEQLGAELIYSEDAYTLHGSDHTEVATWMRRAYRYGINDLRIARKHAALAHADPWRYWYFLPRAARPLLTTAVTLPSLSKRAARVAMSAALASDRLGARGPALRLCGLVFGMEYFRGMRDECGSLLDTWRSRRDYLVKAAKEPTLHPALPRRRAFLFKAWDDLRADHGWYEDRYSYKGVHERSIKRDLVEKIGLQIAAGYRLMRFFRDAELPTLAKITARAVRHLYVADINWQADLSPGIMFVHGMGLAIHAESKVGPRCVLAQNVTLGLGRDPVTQETGAPTLEANVRVGAGATLLGPITIGEGSKIMPGVVLMESVPANSIVEPPRPIIRERRSPASRRNGGGDHDV